MPIRGAITTVARTFAIETARSVTMISEAADCQPRSPVIAAITLSPIASRASPRARRTQTGLEPVALSAKIAVVVAVSEIATADQPRSGSSDAST